MLDATMEVLEKELEHAPKDAFEWQVFADLYEERGNSDMAAGIRAWTKVAHEPLFDPQALGDYFHRCTREELEQWNDDNYGSSPIEGPSAWRWQSDSAWTDDMNFVTAEVFEKLEGNRHNEWVWYRSRVEAVLDLIQASAAVFGPGVLSSKAA